MIHSRSFTKLLSRNLAFSRALSSSRRSRGRSLATASSPGDDADREVLTVGEKSENLSSNLSPSKLPKLTDIPYQAKVANAVQLVGKIAAPVALKMDEHGKSSASTVLLQEKTTNHSIFCKIPIVFLDDLADMAAWHLEENQTVYVTGQLSGGDACSSGKIEEEGLPYLEVVVDSISFVHNLKTTTKHNLSNTKQEPSLEKFDCSTTEQMKAQVQESGQPLVNSKKSLKPESFWKDFVDNPQQWIDCRMSKKNGFVNHNYPDFKSKNTKDGVWLNMFPLWVIAKLDELEFDILDGTRNGSSSTYSAKRGTPTPSTPTLTSEESWKDLVENPSQWWDNRAIKLTPNHPDFKHKESGMGLWLNNSRTPAWVLNRLP